MDERFAALDSGVLLAIQAGAPVFVEAHQLLKKAKFIFKAVPTVIQITGKYPSQTWESPDHRGMRR